MTVSNEIKRFIDRYIGSVQQLDVLIIVCSEPLREWTAEEIGKMLGLPVPAVTNRLLNLCVKGLVFADSRPVHSFRYQPKDPSMDALVKNLNALYKDERSHLVAFIASRAENQLRNFSDAFRLSQEEENG